MTHIPLLVAFIAGLVSFLSPCVLPLIPGYLAYLASGARTSSRSATFIQSVFFVAGFSVVFAVIGVLLNTVLEAVAYDVLQWLGRIGGLVIIFFGLSLLGVLKVSFLERARHIRVARFRSSYATSFIFGAAFAAGWTPCVGAVLGSILGLAVSQPGIAFTLLFTYALGFGIPFLAVGLFTAQATALITRYGGWIGSVNKIFGAFLVLLGTLIFTGTLNRYANIDALTRLWGL